MTKAVAVSSVAEAPRRGRPAASADARRDRAAAIRQAVVSCLQSTPVGDIAIDDIARVAGVSRRTFYRFFDSRRSLFAEVLQERAVAIAARVKTFTARCDGFAEAVVEGSMETLRLTAADRVFKALTEADSKLMLDIMNIDVESPDGPLFVATWAAVFEKGRAAGVIRRSISDSQAAHWLRGIHYLLSLRPDLAPAEKRALLVDFVVPSLTLTEDNQRNRNDSSRP